MREALGPFPGRQNDHVGHNPGRMQALHHHIEVQSLHILIGQDRTLTTQIAGDGLGPHVAENLLTDPNLVGTPRKRDGNTLFARHIP